MDWQVTQTTATTPAALGSFSGRQLYEQIADRLEAEIRLGALQPGQRLPGERELAKRLDVSRSSVREAIASLQVAGVLETRHGAGSFVAEDALARLAEHGDSVLRTPADASPTSLLEARVSLEPAIARLAAQRGRRDPHAEDLLAVMDDARDLQSPQARANWNDADRLFHRQLGVMTANPVLIAICDYIAELMDQPLWRRLRDESIAVHGRAQIHMAEHRMIYESVSSGDPEVAEFYATEHIRRVRRYMTLD